MNIHFMQCYNNLKRLSNIRLSKNGVSIGEKSVKSLRKAYRLEKMVIWSKCYGECGLVGQFGELKVSDIPKLCTPFGSDEAICISDWKGLKNGT